MRDRSADVWTCRAHGTGWLLSLRFGTATLSTKMLEGDDLEATLVAMLDFAEVN